MVIKLYQRDRRGRLLYREAWVETIGEAVVHHGTVGRKGKREQRLFKGSKAAFLKAFERDAREKGYAPIADADQFWLVVQFPLKSKTGAKRDWWLLEKVTEYLDDELGWRGLGHVDGNDIGDYQLNIFSVVVDEPLGVTAAKSCLRESRLDFGKARIATRGYDAEDDYVLRYSKKPVADFAVT